MAPRLSRRARSSSSLLANGEPMIWLTGGALVLCGAMVAGLVVLVLWEGLATFWPHPVVAIEASDGTYMGEITRVDAYRPAPAAVTALPEDDRARAAARLDAAGGRAERRLVRTGNFRLTRTHFHWVSDFEVRSESRPEWALTVERLEWGRFYGFPTAFVEKADDGSVVRTEGPQAAWRAFRSQHAAVRERWRERRRLEERDMGAVHRAREMARIRAEIDAINAENARFELEMRTAGEGPAAPRVTSLALDDIVRAYPANRLGLFGKLGIYASRWREFLTDEPREANSEGGVFPAIFGTVAMTLAMTIAVVPLGVMAALYLREYAKSGALVSTVRIAVNNLAGVPSIVIGVFGLGFFCYVVGAGIDELLFAERLPNPTYGTGGLLWASLTLALLTLPVVIVATEEAIAAVPGSMREGSYACGASQWQTIRRIVLPRAMPGIITGAILAIARGAGEVAPLMLVGAVKLAPELPVDGVFPFVHPERSFMHLGFHIYDVGFQSQNSEAAKPMVFTTTLLLIAIVATLNLAAIGLRGHLRKRYAGGQF